MNLWKRTKKVLATVCCLAVLAAMVPAAGAVLEGVDEDNLYRPNPACGTYLGENSAGVFEFEITIPDDRENQPTPLLPGPFYSTHEITKTGSSAGSTDNIIYTRAQYFYGCRPGTADISYSVYQSGESSKLKAVVHVTVLAKADYDEYMNSASTPVAQDHNHSWYYHWRNPDCKCEGTFYRECNRCKTKETLATYDKVDHMYRVSITRQPTQNSDGIRTYTCGNCNYKYTETIPRLSGGTTTTQPSGTTTSQPGGTTTTQPGGTTTTQPGSTTTTQPGETDPCAKGHSWGAARTTVKATCLAEGESVRTCNVCGEKEITVLSKTDHSWINKTVEATSTKEGRVYRVCSLCGTEETIRTLPKTEPQQVGNSNDSGSASLKKLSKQEIVDLLNSAPLDMPNDPFVTAPSCTAPYSAGKVKTEVLNAAAARLSALRRIAGLPAVTADPTLCEEAQYGAVLLAASEFSHYPKQPSDMDNSFYSKGKDATSSSNIFAGRRLTYTPDGFMDDSDGGNIDRLGHRRWQLNPQLGKVGFGYAVSGKGYGSYTAEKVFDRSGNTSDYNFIAWPASGNFPNDLSAFEKNTAWSVSLNPSSYQTPSASSVSVTLTRESDGKSWSFSGRNSYQASSSGLYFNVDTGGYGVNNCIIFRPNGIDKYEGIYTVTISGLRSKSGGDASLSYQVDFFSTKEAENPTAPVTPATPTTPTTPTNPTAPTITVENIPTMGTAYASTHAVVVDGKKVQFQMYALKDADNNLTNYIRLRDLAYILNDTKAQFSVDYDGTISVTTGQRYTSIGAEMTTPFSGSRSYEGGAQAVKVNNSPVNMTAITLYDSDGGGYNYFKLRDLGKAFGFYVGYSNESGISIDTNRPYSE